MLLVTFSEILKFYSLFRLQGTFGFYIRHSYFRQAFNGLMKAILACDKVISGSTTTSPKIAPPVI